MGNCTCRLTARMGALSSAFPIIFASFDDKNMDRSEACYCTRAATAKTSCNRKDTGVESKNVSVTTLAWKQMVAMFTSPLSWARQGRFSREDNIMARTLEHEQGKTASCFSANKCSPIPNQAAQHCEVLAGEGLRKAGLR